MYIYIYIYILNYEKIQQSRNYTIKYKLILSVLIYTYIILLN